MKKNKKGETRQKQLQIAPSAKGTYRVKNRIRVIIE
jgi:hypothetical protein